MQQDAHLAEDSCGEASDDPAPEADAEVGRAAQRTLRLFGHTAEGKLMAELIHGELTNSVWDLSWNGVRRLNRL